MAYPATPKAGTAIDGPLVSCEQYRQFTTDASSKNEDIVEAILEAEQMVCEMNDITLRYAEYLETLFLYPSGMVYVSADPIDKNQVIQAGGLPIFNPPVDQGQTQAIIQGRGVWIGWFQPAYIPVWTGVVPPQTIIDYWGGYQPYRADPMTTESLPRSMASILSRVAFYSLNPLILEGVPGGNIKSMSVGGVSISGDLESFMQMDSQLRRDIRKWRMPEVVGWGT